MSSKTQILLENISSEAADSGYSFGVKRPAAGYHRTRDNIHTVLYVVSDFVGSLKLQGTLKLDPSDNDWVDIDNTSIGGDSTAFTSSNISSNFTGNFVWVRAAYNIQNGTISKISFSF